MSDLGERGIVLRHRSRSAVSCFFFLGGGGGGFVLFCFLIQFYVPVMIITAHMRLANQ